MYYTGIDEHKDNCFLTTVNDVGVVVKSGRIRNDPVLILDYFQSHPGPHGAVVESTASWYWLSGLLDSQGIELVPAHGNISRRLPTRR